MRALVAVYLLAMTGAAAANDSLRIELNKMEAMQERCRLSFVIENDDGHALDSLKLDLVVFGKNGAVGQRLVAEMGPLRSAKTTVKSFDVSGPCAQIGALLVNDVTACSPDTASACLDRMTLSSRVTDTRFYK